MDIKAFWDMPPEQRKAIEEAVFSKKGQCEHKALLHRQPPRLTQCMDCGHEFPKFETSKAKG